jgi:hypothetical protein
MFYLQVNDTIIHKIQDGHAVDTTFRKTSLPNGVGFDTSDNTLYQMANKICLPNDIFLGNLIPTENNNNAGHPDPKRTLINVSKMFLWRPRMRKQLLATVKLVQHTNTL